MILDEMNPVDSLEEAMHCAAESRIITGFLRAYSISEEEAKDIFAETKKWLWLSAQLRHDHNPHKLFIDSALKVIDEMWHVFILHTKAYDSYCKGKFGYFIHHEPFTRETDSAVDQKPNDYKRNLHYQCGVIYHYLGEQTLIKWYKEYAVKYAPESLDKMRNSSAILQ